MMRQQAHKVDGYPKLSRPLRDLRTEYDVVVVGSGYGAGVAASRMARMGKSVAVLELGWEVRPGSYPESLRECLPHLNYEQPPTKRCASQKKHVPSQRRTKLFQLLLGRGQHAFCAHGLGGGSLINAGVFLQADDATLQRAPWPSEIRDDPKVLSKYYARAADMLQPLPYPEDFGELKKTRLLRHRARQMKKDANFYRVPLTTFFHEGRNSTGVLMQANKGTGHESTGQNDGSKNSVAVTYLADAYNWGAEIFCGCDVQYVEPVGIDAGYIIHFVWHCSGRDQFRHVAETDLFWVKAKEFCFLGAGAAGTTEILLRSRARGLPLSPLVGRTVSGNGNQLLFGYNGLTEVDAVATSRADHSPGPTITSIIDLRSSNQESHPLDGFVIEDGCIPQSFSTFVQLMFLWQTCGQRLSNLAWTSRLRRIHSSLRSLLCGAYARGGALQHTATYLVMSHDSNESALTLESDQIVLSGLAEGRSAHTIRLQEILRKSLAGDGEKLGHSYFYGRHREEVSVHLLGGANMSRDHTGSEGVTTHIGEVFSSTGRDLHQGLFCCDASTMPTSLGVNPIATICAIAERSLDLIAKRSGLQIDLDTRNGNLDRDTKPMIQRSCSSVDSYTSKTTRSTGWQFTEILEGSFYPVARNTKPTAIKDVQGRPGAQMRLCLTVEILQDKANNFLSSFTGVCTGTISCPALSKSALMVTNGIIEFFVDCEERPDAKLITYDLELRSVEGVSYLLRGRKHIDTAISFSIRQTWQATSTLYTTLSVIDGPELGLGMVHNSPKRFYTQMKTFRCMESLQLATIVALLSFITLWICQLGQFFFCPRLFTSVRSKPRDFTDNTSAREDDDVYLKSKDGFRVRLQIYNPVTRSEDTEQQLKKPPILMVPGATGIRPEFNLFDLPFIKCNLVKYFTQLGHRCYVVSPRWGVDVHAAQRSTVYDCRLDIASALTYINQAEQQKVYVIAHCAGSVALSSGLLDGSIVSNSIMGITASAVFMHQIFGKWNSIKSYTTLPLQAYEKIFGDFFPIMPAQYLSWTQRLLDRFLAYYPVTHNHDVCSSSVCHRISLGFGLLWNHQNLNRHTHDSIHRFFAGTYLKLLKHMARSGQTGSCLDNEGRKIMNADNLKRLRGLPILFVSGTENEVYMPESTLRDYELLRRTFGEEQYRRYLVEGYGHLDPIIGQDAARDVYWRIKQHLQVCTAGPQTTLHQ